MWCHKGSFGDGKFILLYAESSVASCRSESQQSKLWTYFITYQHQTLSERYVIAGKFPNLFCVVVSVVGNLDP